MKIRRLFFKSDIVSFFFPPRTFKTYEYYAIIFVRRAKCRIYTFIVSSHYRNNERDCISLTKLEIKVRKRRRREKVKREEFASKPGKVLLSLFLSLSLPPLSSSDDKTDRSRSSIGKRIHR